LNIKIITVRGKTEQVLAKTIKLLKTVNLININKKENYLAISYNSSIYTDSRSLVNLKKKILKMHYVKAVTIFAITKHGRKKQPLHKRYAFFIDIDGTITEKTTKRIDSRTRRIFRLMKNKYRHRIILASGRPNRPVEKQMINLDTTDVAIAENGGVIIGFDAPDDRILGDRDECERTVDYLQNNLNGINEIGEERRAEAIINRKHSPNRLSKLVKGKYDVTFTDSGTSIHINSVGACKGDAVKEILKHFQSWKHEDTIGIGDSDLDISLFEAVGNPMAVANATVGAKKAAKGNILKRRNLDGVIEVFRNFEPRLTLNY